ncbi:MAG: hypothetical protein ACT4PP_15495 [Sporichthyaceae bacterium]
MAVPHPTTWSRASRAGALAALMALPLLAACGSESGSEEGGRFVAAERADYPLTCLEHQGQTPGVLYTGGAEGADTAAIFDLLEYFTANRSVTAYCDGEPANGKDRAWAQLYVDLGAERANVAHLLSSQ